MCPPELKDIILALLLGSKAGLSFSTLQKAIDQKNLTQRKIEKTIGEINQQERGLFTIVKNKGHYQVQLKPRFSPYLQKLKAPTSEKVSQSMLEVLSIMITQQPITRREVDWIRGVSTSTSLYHELEDRGWIKVVGISPELGKPHLYGTTKTLLQYFGMSTLSEFKAYLDQNLPSEAPPFQ